MPMVIHAVQLNQYEDIVIKHAILSEDLFSFYHSLFSLQYDTMHHLTSIITDTKLIVDSTHYPMIHPQNMQFTEEVDVCINNLFTDITTLITQFQPGYSFDTLLAHIDQKPELYKDILVTLLLKDTNFETITLDNKIGTDELIFLAINVYKPLFVVLKNTTLQEQTDFPEHSEAWCPFCGFLPDMAKIVESKNNKRFLHCALCECEWEYKRVKCVACGNENTDTLGYYSYQPDEKYRFDYCDTCKTYIKTLQIAKQYDESQYDLAVENIVTTFLDASALKMGYTRQ